jgi:hypothetical protein
MVFEVGGVLDLEGVGSGDGRVSSKLLGFPAVPGADVSASLISMR